MALNNEEKLKSFEIETMEDAQKICDEIREKIKTDFQEKVSAGEKRLLSEINDFIETEADKARKEKSLEISRAGIQYRHEYLKYSDEMFAKIFEGVHSKLDKFLSSDDYFIYLKNSCVNAIDKIGAKNIDILYAPKDQNLIAKLKLQLDRQLKKSGVSDINFIPDNEIKTGGLRFRDTTNNILISEVLDEKFERAKEMLTASIGLLFKQANQERGEIN